MYSYANLWLTRKIRLVWRRVFRLVSVVAVFLGLVACGHTGIRGSAVEAPSNRRVIDIPVDPRDGTLVEQTRSG